ncbi:hypothetical protein TanjilG_11540 [Lupinus angustifolius]|uniref:Phytocyanin domain-containing protein n=2 Tax=Lupinus angustifolius TaxID=3871 RepID=A0A1J7GNE2_LUPAN|nr:hypothetical protein TanjilG_11540 [Lupinus angustifolius]
MNIFVVVFLAMVTLFHGSVARTIDVATPAPEPMSATPPLSLIPESAPTSAPSNGSVTYTVGDNIGWTIPNDGASAYVTWASSKNFKVGDILVFNYEKNAHNVEEVTKEKYDSCNSVSPLSIYSNTPQRVTINKSGPHYFICGVPGHCSAGQKLAINVTTITATATATFPSSNATLPSTSTTLSFSPPQNHGAASLGLFGIMLYIVVAFFY